MTYKDKFPVIKTERLQLRKFGEADLGNVFKGLSHPDIIKYYGVSFDSLEATKEQIKWFSMLEDTGTGIWWAICSLDGKTFYGGAGFNELSQSNKKAEVGLWLLPEFWGKGIMQETMSLICNYAFDQLGLHRIEGFVETKNTNCKKALSKLQFIHEGTMKDCEVKDGELISLDIYAKFKTK
jgi:ribosomal-protein-alanine N-acetyltransferase